MNSFSSPWIYRREEPSAWDLQQRQQAAAGHTQHQHQFTSSSNFAGWIGYSMDGLGQAFSRSAVQGGQILQAQVPAGMHGGQLMPVMTAAGLMPVQIPDGLQPGISFQMQMPAVQHAVHYTTGEAPPPPLLPPASYQHQHHPQPPMQHLQVMPSSTGPSLALPLQSAGNRHTVASTAAAARAGAPAAPTLMTTRSRSSSRAASAPSRAASVPSRLGEHADEEDDVEDKAAEDRVAQDAGPWHFFGGRFAEPAATIAATTAADIAADCCALPKEDDSGVEQPAALSADDPHTSEGDDENEKDEGQEALEHSLQQEAAAAADDGEEEEAEEAVAEEEMAAKEEAGADHPPLPARRAILKALADGSCERDTIRSHAFKLHVPSGSPANHLTRCRKHINDEITRMARLGVYMVEADGHYTLTDEGRKYMVEVAHSSAASTSGGDRANRSGSSSTAPTPARRVPEAPDALLQTNGLVGADERFLVRYPSGQTAWLARQRLSNALLDVGEPAAREAFNRTLLPELSEPKSTGVVPVGCVRHHPVRACADYIMAHWKDGRLPLGDGSSVHGYASYDKVLEAHDEAQQKSHTLLMTNPLLPRIRLVVPGFKDMEASLVQWLNQKYNTVVELFFAHGLAQSPKTLKSTGFDVHQVCGAAVARARMTMTPSYPHTLPRTPLPPHTLRLLG